MEQVNQSSNIPGGAASRMHEELVRMGAIERPAGTVPPPTPGVVVPPPAPAAGQPPVPAAPGTVPQPGVVVGQPAPAPQPKNGEVVQGEVGPNGEPLVYVVHDNTVSKMTISEIAADHSYKAHNTRVGQENADKRRELDLRETKIAAREAQLAAGGRTFDELISGEGAGVVAPPPVAPAVVVPPMPSIELAVENAAEYNRQVAAREQAMDAKNAALIASSVHSAVQPLTQQLEQSSKEREDAEKQAQRKALMDAKMVALKTRLPQLDMNLVNGFLQRLPHEESRMLNHPDGYELVWSRILRGEQPGAVPITSVPAGYPPAPVPGTPPPTAYPAPPAAPRPPYAEPGAGGGRVTHSPPVAPGGSVPNLSSPDMIAQALIQKRAQTGPTVYYPEAAR